MTISVPTTLESSQQIVVSVSGSSRVNETITVSVDDGEQNSDEIEIDINGEGSGSNTWTVPTWERANFRDDHCNEESRPINPPPGD